MAVTVRSFAKVNLGLYIGPSRPDGFHELRTVYQTVALHDIVRVQVSRGSGIEIRCADPRVPTDASNTCYRIVERAMAALKTRGRVVIDIEKRLPVQGGLGGASGNAVAALLALEIALKKQIPGPHRLRIAAEVGSDLPLFLIGGTVLGVGRGEEVYPLPDLPATPCVIATPEVGVSTPQAFVDWDAMQRQNASKLTASAPSDRMVELGRVFSAWRSGSQRFVSGVPAGGRVRAETPLLDLVRTGIENDFEKVVFPKYPELREAKRGLERAGAFYASLSGSGSAIYGLFRTAHSAQRAAEKLPRQGVPAEATRTLTRQQYSKKFLVSSF
jgi:4-diphosphocytidyl-2-C-methyl-D-erythritol kinase